jgi:predicted N-acetyltransferase YhbS
MKIRQATERDFAEILKIQAEAFGEYQGTYDITAWTKETLENIRLNAQDKVILVAERDERLVGSVRFWIAGGVCVIRLLSVHPDFQGRGIGKALMQEIERTATTAHKLYVCTMLKTSRNVALFLKLGYRPETVLPDHYDHTDFICFAKYCGPDHNSSPDFQ